MKLTKLRAELSGWLERAGDLDVRILVTHPGTGENMLFDIEGVDGWDGPSGLTLMVQNFPAELRTLKVVK